MCIPDCAKGDIKENVLTRPTQNMVHFHVIALTSDALNIY